MTLPTLQSNNNSYLWPIPLDLLQQERNYFHLLYPFRSEREQTRFVGLRNARSMDFYQMATDIVPGSVGTSTIHALKEGDCRRYCRKLRNFSLHKRFTGTHEVEVEHTGST